MFKPLINNISTFKEQRVGGDFVFSDADTAITKHYHEKGYIAYKIWKDNPEKHWDKTSVKRLIRRFEAFDTMERKKGFGRPRTATTPEN